MLILVLDNADQNYKHSPNYVIFMPWKVRRKASFDQKNIK